MKTTPPVPQSSAVPAFDADHMGAALGRIPSGLFVISWQRDGRDHVMLASWVMQAGFEPPIVSVAVGTAREFLTAARERLPFVVNVLAESQRSLLARFGKPIPAGEAPFDGIGIERTPDGVAAISGVAASLACRMVGEATLMGTDHVVVLAEVLAARGTADVAPVIHLRRNGLKY